MKENVAAPAQLEPPTAATTPAGISAATRRELGRARRAEAARLSALVQYMLHRGVGDSRSLTHD